MNANLSQSFQCYNYMNIKHIKLQVMFEVEQMKIATWEYKEK